MEKTDLWFINIDPPLISSTRFVLNGSGCEENLTFKRAQVVSIQRWVTSLESFLPGNKKQTLELFVDKANNISDK